MRNRVSAARRLRRKRRAAARREAVPADLRLAEIPLREMVELVRIDLPAEQVEPLLEMGLLPGCRLCPVRRSPFGDPVLLVDGTLIAVRREMAGCLCVRRPEPAAN
ncbi:MAG TPA: FeoA family protein [Longimicrobiales bacterium]|nr:FeoA family protein [Longimicrobiales bacterium]